MKHFEFNWTTKDDLTLFAQGWDPDIDPLGVVCLVHGLGEHSGRYAHLGEVLTTSGYALMAFDLRGHGKSQGKRGHSPSNEAYMDDITHLLAEAAQRYSNLPSFLYGHSLGGILVLYYALHRRPNLTGVIASAPGLRTVLETQKLKIFFARVMGTFLPGLSMPSGLDPATISSDPSVVQDYINDPLVHDRATLGFAKNTLQAIGWTFEHASEFPLPLLLMHGTGDKIAFPEGSQEFAKLVPGDCTIKLWDGLSHEIHNEPEKGEVIAYLLEWLTKKRGNARG